MGKLIFAIVLLIVGIVAYRVLRRMAASPQMAQEPGFSRGLTVVSWVALVVGLVLPTVILTFSILRIIPAGQVGVKVLFGQVDPIPLREGLNVIWNPLYDVQDMDVRVLKHAAKYDAASKDLQAVHVDMVLNFRLVSDRTPEVYRTLGLNYSGVIIDPAAQEVLKANTALHNAAEILIKRPALKNDIQKDLTVWLAKYGIELKEAALANIRFDPTYEKAIEAKQIEEQRAEQKRYELVQAQRQAEIAAARAKGEADAAREAAKGAADAAREKAKGEADALRITSDAQAAYNQKVAASLTPTLIQQQYLTRWNGQLPQFMMDSRGGSGLLLQLPGQPVTSETIKK